jgi:shikimate dehydrogenase
MRVFGLIGYPLGHSFSKRYFTEKFVREGITDAVYELFPLADIADLPGMLASQPHLRGLNVTIPYKEQVLPFLTELDPAARRIGAVNVIRIGADGSRTGYNSDYFGFRDTLETFLGNSLKNAQNANGLQALVLGTGGASKAVKVALEDMGIGYVSVSRQAGGGVVSYADVTPEMLGTHRLRLIINTTPLGMYPNVNDCPPLPYEALTSDHFLYDLVYNPEQTVFLERGAAQGAKTFGGLPMLHGQAEKSWEIWN